MAQRPFVGLLIGLLVMVAYVPGTTGAAIPTGWVALWAILPIVLFFCRPVLTAAHWAGLIFLILAIPSVNTFTGSPFAFMRLVALAMVFVWAATLDDGWPVVMGLAIGLLVSDVVAAAQVSGSPYVPPRITRLPAGLFVNSNVFAEITALIGVLLVTYRAWMWLPVTIPGALCASRAALFGVLIAGLWWLWERASTRVRLVCALAAPAALAALYYHRPAESRLAMWGDTLRNLTPFGHGVGSFEYLYPAFGTFDPNEGRPQFLHNDPLQFVFEFGVLALPLFFMIWILLRTKDRHRYALATFLVIGLFGFPAFMPATAFVFAFVAGRIAAGLPAVRLGSLLGRPALYPRR